MTVGSGATIDVAGTGIVNANNTYLYLANSSSTGTFVNQFVRLVNSTAVNESVAGANSIPILGVCVSGCGTTGTAKIQVTGLVSVWFDNAAQAGFN